MNEAVSGGGGTGDWAAPSGVGERAVGTPDAWATSAPPAPRATPTYRSWQPGLIPLRPITFGEFLGVPFKAMRFNRAVVIGGPLLCVAGAMVLLAAALWLVFTDPALALTSPSSQLQGIQTTTVAALIAAAVALILADTLASALVAPAVARATLGQRIGVATAFRAVSPRIPSLLLLWLLSIVAMGITAVPGVLLIIVGRQDDSGQITVLGVLAIVGLALLAALPVFLITAVARCVIVLERVGAVAAIRRTLRVIRGRFWWSVLIVLTTGAIISVVTSVFQQASSVAGMIIVAVGFNGGWWATAVAVAVLVLASVVGYVFSYAYMGCVYALIYIDARIRHEGFDMDLARVAEAGRA